MIDIRIDYAIPKDGGMVVRDVILNAVNAIVNYIHGTESVLTIILPDGMETTYLLRNVVRYSIIPHETQNEREERRDKIVDLEDGNVMVLDYSNFGEIETGGIKYV